MLKYKIYALSCPEHLQRTVFDSYHVRTVRQNILVELSEYIDRLPYGAQTEFSSPQEAANWLLANNQEYKLWGTEYVILPSIQLSFSDDMKPRDDNEYD